MKLNRTQLAVALLLTICIAPAYGANKDIIELQTQVSQLQQQLTQMISKWFQAKEPIHESQEAMVERGILACKSIQPDGSEMGKAVALDLIILNYEIKIIPYEIEVQRGTVERKRKCQQQPIRKKLPP